MYKVREYSLYIPHSYSIEIVCNDEYEKGWELVSLSVQEKSFVCVFRRHSDFEV